MVKETQQLNDSLNNSPIPKKRAICNPEKRASKTIHDRILGLLCSTSIQCYHRSLNITSNNTLICINKRLHPYQEPFDHIITRLNTLTTHFAA